MCQLLYPKPVVRQCRWQAAVLSSVKILDALQYFRLYKLALRMGTDPVLTAMAFHGCSKVDWETTAVRYGFILYEFRTGEVHGL